MLHLPRRSVVIAVDEVDRLAGDLIAIEGDGLGSAHAKVPEEIEHIVLLHRRIHALQDGRIHLSCVRERTIAVANNVEVPNHYCPVDDAPSVCNRMMRLSLRAIWGGVDLNWV